MLRATKTALLCGLVSSLLVLTNCAAPIVGAIYTGVQSGVAATPQAGPKWGEACATGVLGLFAFGDASIEAARKNGGISSIASVDQKIMSILGVYSQYCTTVRGK